jgi:hypothetical protein
MAKRLRAFHIENARVEDCDAGWDIYLFDDGTELGTIVWFFYGGCGTLGNIEVECGLDLDDVFTDREIERLWEMEFSKPKNKLGTRYRMLSVQDWDSMASPAAAVRNNMGQLAA